MYSNTILWACMVEGTFDKIYKTLLNETNP